MSKDKENDQSRIDDIRQKNIRSELQNLRADIQDVKTTWQDDRPNATRKTKWAIGKWKNYIIIAIAVGILAWFAFGPENFEIPEWIYVAIVGILAGVAIGIIPARIVVDMFVKDTRKPVLCVNPDNLHDVEVHYVPQERIPDMKVVSGDKATIETKKGTGYEVEQMELVEHNGKEHILAKGSWIGEKTGLELRRKEGEIQAMRKSLKPMAQKGFAYEVMWPSIMHEMQSEIANMFAKEFQDVAIFQGNELKTKVDDVVGKYHPDKINEKVDKEDIDKSDLVDNESANMTNGHDENSTLFNEGDE